MPICATALLRAPGTIGNRVFTSTMQGTGTLPALVRTPVGFTDTLFRAPALLGTGFTGTIQNTDRHYGEWSLPALFRTQALLGIGFFTGTLFRAPALLRIWFIGTIEGIGTIGNRIRHGLSHNRGRTTF